MMTEEEEKPYAQFRSIQLSSTQLSTKTGSWSRLIGIVGGRLYGGSSAKTKL